MTSDLHVHVAPEPREAAEPQPVRTRDLVRDKALRWGYAVMTGEGPALATFPSFKAAVEAYELYRAVHDRRSR